MRLAPEAYHLAPARTATEKPTSARGFGVDRCEQIRMFEQTNITPVKPPRHDQALRSFRIQAGSRLPLHAQAEQQLRRLVDRPEYAAGGLLPDEVSLSSALGVSRNTMRAALSRLVQEGRLERKPGVGTRAVKPKAHSGVGAWHSFTHEMEQKGIQVETYSRSVRFVSAPAEAARRLQIDAGQPVLCLDRVRGWDSKPVVRFLSYFHPRLGLSADADFEQPLYELIGERCRVFADQSKEDLTAVAADQKLARLLGVKPGAPLLRRDRTVLDAGGRPIEYAVVHYRGDRFELTLNLRHE